MSRLFPSILFPPLKQNFTNFKFSRFWFVSGNRDAINRNCNRTFKSWNVQRLMFRFFLTFWFRAFACASIRVYVCYARLRDFWTKGDNKKRFILILIDNISDNGSSRIPSRLIKRKKKKKCQATLRRTKSPINFVRCLDTRKRRKKKQSSQHGEKIT